MSSIEGDLVCCGEGVLVVPFQASSSIQMQRWTGRHHHHISIFFKIQSHFRGRTVHLLMGTQKLG